MSQENYIISVYDAITKQIADIEVSEAVYNEYRRGGWSIHRSDRRFRTNEIPFSDLKGGLDGAYENFDEFRSEADNPAGLLVQQLTRQQLQMALSELDKPDQALLIDLFEHGKTEREIAAARGVSQNAINKRRQRLIKKLKNILS